MDGCSNGTSRMVRLRLDSKSCPACARWNWWHSSKLVNASWSLGKAAAANLDPIEMLHLYCTSP
eukprot:3572578-Amphidinium_carterae.1